MKNKNHIIPKLILHKHSTIPNGYKAHHLWLHNTQSTQDKYVPTDSQCYQHRLYELYDEKHNIIQGTENMIENTLAELEKTIAPIIQAIQQNKLLSDEEQTGLALFTAIQIMRTPEVIDFYAAFLHQYAPQLTPCQSQQLARIQGLLIRPSLKGNETLYKVLEWLCSYRMVVWRSPWNNAFIINQNRPVGVFMPTRGNPQNAIVTYPASATHCLAFVHDNQKNQEYYIATPSEWVDLVNYYNYTNKTTLVYCKYIVTALPFYKRLILRQYDDLNPAQSIRTFSLLSHNLSNN